MAININWAMSARYCRSFALRFALVVGVLLSVPNVAEDALPAPITALLERYQIPTTAVSLEIVEMPSAVPDNEPLLSVNAHASRNPASAIKLLTTLTALELLGPAYHWETTYLSEGEIVDGVLQGDLILRGGGDPFLTVERLLEHVLSLRQLGIKRINGQLVLDNSQFTVQPHNRSEFDGEPQRLYNVEPSAILTNFSATDFVIEPRGEQIHISLVPPLSGVQIINRLTAQDGACINPNAGWSHKLVTTDEIVSVHFTGTYRKRCGRYLMSRSILPNNDYTHRLFTALWYTMGGQINKGYKIAPTPKTAQELLIRESEPLADIITGINKFSNNVMARQLLLSIGMEDSEATGSVKSGRKAINRWLAQQRINMPKLVLVNGSGLSRSTRVSARGLSTLLAHAWRSTYFPEFISSLSLSALDGTMRSRLNETPLLGRARVKTGLIDGVRSMAGYVHARSGKHYSVALLVDSKRINYWNGNEIQDALLLWMYEL